MPIQMKVKPVQTPVLPASFTYTGSDGNVQTMRLNKGVAGKEFDARLTEYGDQWVYVNGPVGTAGIGPSGLLVPSRVDGNGNPFAAPPSILGPGSSPSTSASIAYQASRLIKATPGVLFGLSGYNSGAAQFIQIFDYAGGIVPPDTTSIPVAVMTAAGTANFSFDFGYWGLTCSAGIWVTNSSTGPTKTIGSADCFFTARFS